MKSQIKLGKKTPWIPEYLAHSARLACLLGKKSWNPKKARVKRLRKIVLPRKRKQECISG